MRDTVLGWIEMCELGWGEGTPPVDELLAAGYPIAAAVVADTYTAGLRWGPAVARWVRARDACFGPDRIRAVDDIPAGIVVSEFICPSTLDEATAADDTIRSGYVCPGWRVGNLPVGTRNIVLRLRAAADPEANAAIEYVADDTDDSDDADGFGLPVAPTAAQVAASCVRNRHDATGVVARVVGAVAVEQLDPELALAIVLRHGAIGKFRETPSRLTVAAVIGDALEAKLSAHVARLVMPPIII